MQNPLLIKSFVAGAAMNANRLAKIGAADGQVLLAAGSTVADRTIGITVSHINPASGSRVDVVMAGIYEAVAGGAITRGDPITSDATGQAVVAAPGAGVNARIIGFALESAVAGDLVSIHIEPGFLQG